MRKAASRDPLSGEEQNEALAREILLVPHFGSVRWGRGERRVQLLSPACPSSIPARSSGGAGFRCPLAEDLQLPLGPARAPNPVRGRGQRPLPSPPRIEDELPLVSVARSRAPGLRAEAREGRTDA